MNLFDPVSSIMTTDLLVAETTDTMARVATIFQNHKIHHIPVVRGLKLVGMVSRSDYLAFCHNTFNAHDASKIEDIRLEKHTVDEIMTTGLAKIKPDVRISVLLEIFKENIFHSVPIVDDTEKLIGIVTTYDIISNLAKDKEAHIGYA